MKTKALSLASRVPQNVRTGGYKNLEDYLEELGLMGLTKTQIKGRKAVISEFVAIAECEYLTDIDAYHIDAFADHLAQRPNQVTIGGLSEMTIYTYLRYVRDFCRYLMSAGILKTDPFSCTSLTSPNYETRRVLSRQEIEALYASCQSYLDRLILSLYYGCGLRRSEGGVLDVKDVDLTKGRLYVRSGKGGKRRMIPLSPSIQKDIDQYIRFERPMPENPKDKALICSQKRRKRLGVQSISNIFKALVRRSGIDPHRISLHNLRHSIATHLLQAGMTSPCVQAFLGHAHLDTTQQYVRISKEQVWQMS